MLVSIGHYLSPFGVAPFLMFLGHILCWKTIIPIRLAPNPIVVSFITLYPESISQSYPRKMILYPNHVSPWYPQYFWLFFLFYTPLYSHKGVNLQNKSKCFLVKPPFFIVYKTPRVVFKPSHVRSMPVASHFSSEAQPASRTWRIPSSNDWDARYHSRVQNSFIFAEKSKLT